MAIDELLIDFDEMGFAPTTLCENPNEYACKWKRQLLAEINALKEKCEELLNKMWDAQDDLDCYYDEMPTRINQAVQDFAEKLRKRLTENRLSNDNVVINANYEIDELLKEYE